MRHNKPSIFSSGTISISYGLLFILCMAALIGYVFNIVKLVNCDFQEPYKAEIIHIVGLVPPIGAITGWLDVGK